MASGIAVAIINTTVMLVAYPVFLHFLGYKEYGVWLVLSTVLSFAKLGNLGINQAVVKLVAEEHGRSNNAGIQQCIVTALAILCLSGSLILFFIFIFKIEIISLFRLDQEDTKTALWLLPYIGILSIYVFIVHALTGMLSGLGRMDLANYAEALGRIVSVICSTTLLHYGHGIKSLLIGNILSYVSIHLISYLCIHRIVNFRLFYVCNFNLHYCLRILRFSGGIVGGSLVSMLVSPFNKLMLSRYVGVASIPVYDIAFNGSVHIRSLIQFAFNPLVPEASRLSTAMTKCATDRITNVFCRAVKLIIICGVPLYSIMFILATPLLKLWLGQKFDATLPAVFRIITIGALLSLLSVPSFNILLGIGRVRHCLTSHLIQGFTNVAVVIIVSLLFNLSLVSVAWGVTLGMSIKAFYLLWCTRLSTKAGLCYIQK